MYPDKSIETLAYAYTEAPPAKTRPRHNVHICMCPIGACQAHPYEKCRYDTYIMNHLRGWAKITDGGDLYVWHYNANYSHYLLPVPDFDELAADLPMYKRNCVVGLFMQGSVPEGGSEAPLRAYVLARLLWDVNANVPKAIREFHEIYYGRAAALMLAYFRLVQNLVRFPPEGEGQHWWCCRSPRFGDATLDKARQLFAQAQAEAENETVRMRVQKAQLSFDYVEFVRAKKFAVRNGTYEPADLADVRNRYQALLSQAQSFGITYFGEGKTLEDENKNFAHVKPYPVKSLENPSLLLHIVPGLSGRVIQMIDKRTGHDALVPPAPEDGRYPDGGGLGVFVSARFGRHGDFQSLFHELLEVKWELDADSPRDRCVLTGACANGLILKRTIQIPAEGASVHTETHLQNAGNNAIEVALLSVFSANPTQGLAPEEMDNVSIAFSTQDGKAIEKKLIDRALEPIGSATYAGSSQPDRQWRMVNPKPGLTLVNRFDKAQVERCFLRWSAKNQNSVSLALLSPKRRLEPGESTRLDADYSLGK